jgi:hypothetical protein
MRVLVADEAAWDARDAFSKIGLRVSEIEGYPHYLVTACGKVFSRNHSCGPLGYFKEIRPRLSGPVGKQYLAVTLCSSNGRRSVRVHRLVAEAFCERRPEHQCVRHLNGLKTDNRAVNLAWGTFVENEADKRAHGTYELRRNGKLSVDAIRLAQRLAAAGTAQKDIAERLGVSRPAITRLLNGSTWGNITCGS